MSVGRRLSLFAVALVLALAPSARVSGAPGTTCELAGGTATVTIQPGATVTIGRSGDAIAVDGSPCQTSTVLNTDLIDVVQSDPSSETAETVIVDLAGGPLAPGAADEGDGSPEVEIDVDTGDAAVGAADVVRVDGSSGIDAIHVEQPSSVNLNADEATDDLDVTVAGTDDPTLEIGGGDGDDALSIAYTEAGAFFGQKELAGEGGDDRLTGPLDGLTVLDGGEGTDMADYASSAFELTLIWGTESVVWAQDADVDELVDVEIGILTPQMDQVIYQAGGVGEARLGADVDFAVVMGATDANDPDERVIRGGPGTFDWVVADIGVSSLELTPDTITGSFAVRYAGFEYVESGPGDDRFGIGTRGAYPSLVGREGDDVLDLRSATEGISVTLGQDPYGWRRWVLAYEFERVLGSPFADQLLGPDDETPVRMRGGDGPDVLRGGDGDDVLRGGAGFDACTGGSGVDLLSGCER